ncbi:MAG: hypothetical protein K8U57_07005 [Planctomycetes bacterium]|nr:hypothetical protein [Planctomycetota bacterium]
MPKLPTAHPIEARTPADLPIRHAVQTKIKKFHRELAETLAKVATKRINDFIIFDMDRSTSRNTFRSVYLSAGEILIPPSLRSPQIPNRVGDRQRESGRHRA